MRRPIIVLALLFVVALGLIAAKAQAAAKYPVSYNFLSSAVLAGTQVNADPPGSNDWSCRPTARHPRPVVLVHGTAGNKNTNWQTYAPLLANNGYCVFAFTYGVAAGTPPGLDQFGGLDDIETSAGELKTFVAKVLRRHRREAGRPRRPLPGHADAGLLAEVPRRCALRARLRLARPALARHQPRRAAAARGRAEGLRDVLRRPRLPGLHARCRPARPS